jgi:hypothetical protein
MESRYTIRGAVTQDFERLVAIARDTRNDDGIKTPKHLRDLQGGGLAVLVTIEKDARHSKASGKVADSIRGGIIYEKTPTAFRIVYLLIDKDNDDYFDVLCENVDRLIAATEPSRAKIEIALRTSSKFIIGAFERLGFKRGATLRDAYASGEAAVLMRWKMIDPPKLRLRDRKIVRMASI